MRNNRGKFWAVLLTVLMMSVSMGSALPLNVQAETYTTGKVTAPSKETWVNIRKDPSMTGKVLTCIKYGTALKIYSTTDTGWVLVTIPSGTKGYIYKTYVESDSVDSSTDENEQEVSDESAKDTNASVISVSAGSKVNVRKKASKSSAVVGRLANGSDLIVTNQLADWCYITMPNGTKGYISSKYVRHEICTLDPGDTGTTTSGVNIRQKPTKKVLTAVAKGTKLKVISIFGQWYRVKANGKTGYIYALYLK